MSEPGRENDPFAAFESERTVIKPAAGRGAPRTAAGAAAAAAPRAEPAGREAPMAMDALMTANLNPLVAAAAPLLSAAPRIRAMATHPNPAGLKDALADGIRKFEQQARAEGLPNEQVIAGRYILCTLLDESAASTPWGSSGVWSNQSLLVQFHNETWGGEKVFQLMSKLAENVAANRNLLELMYVVLAFGFEGRYRVANDGRAQLDSVRTRLAQMLKGGKERAEAALSPRWEGVAAEGKLRAGIPMWVVMSLAAIVLALVYFGMRLGINSYSDPVFATLQALDVKPPPVAAAPPPPPPPAAPRLAGLLKPDIDAGRVQVQDLGDRSIVIIKGDGMFQSGGAVLSDEVMPTLARIQAALMKVPGRILITGHTDSQPIRSLRFPSNWHLSQARADSVKMMLGANIKAERLRAEGRAESEPVGDNATAEGRAKNRRVEITLFVPLGD